MSELLCEIPRLLRARYQAQTLENMGVLQGEDEGCTQMEQHERKNFIPETYSCLAIRKAAQHMTRLYDDMLSPVDIGLNHYSILANLDHFGPKILQELAALLIMNPSTLGRRLRPLEERGLITVKSSAKDRRRKIIALTKKGAELVTSAKLLWAKVAAQFEDSKRIG
jgi:DNA-binding MarR family transcriptional regulator